MKVLLINNYHYLRGGSERAYFDMGKLLEDNGHEVAYFSTRDSKNKDSKYSKYFVQDFDLQGDYNIFKKINIALRAICNSEAKRNINKVLDNFNPDKVVLHNIYHHLTPVIIKEIKKRSIKIIQVVHDYKIICPNYKLFSNNKICEKCKGGKYYNCLLYKCGNKSFFRSLFLMIESYINSKKYNQVDLFIAPSEFVRKKFIEFGINEKKIVVLNHFVDIKKFKPSSNIDTQDYLLYYGRLSREKGIDVIINAVNDLPGQKLKIVGDGDIENELEKLSDNNHNIEFLGHKSGKELNEIIQKAKAVIVPSVWYEVFGLTILEAMAMGKLVIASRIGAVSEIIQDGDNGYLFEMGNKEDLKNKILAINKQEKEKNVIQTVNKYEKNGYYRELLKLIK